MRVLALDAALAQCAAAMLIDDTVVSRRQLAGGRGHAAVLPPMAEAVLAEAGCAASDLDGVAVTIGPGSFTGLRAAISLAHGIALAAGRPVVGVTVAEAMASALPPTGDRALWVAIDSRRKRVFLDHDGILESVALDALPPARGPVAVAGDAAIEVAARLLARGDDVVLTALRLPPVEAVARVGARRLAGLLPPLAAQPIYLEPPEARLPAGGLRPPPTA
jgi:tRNA threonylcarbamoyladenosine biosynthesis protein TsaB